MINDELGNILIYQTENGDTKIDAYFEDNTIWLSQKNLAQLYQVEVHTINEHISNIIADEELAENPTIRNFRIVQKEGTREVAREVKHYNLDMILAIGYRVRSNVGMHFAIHGNTAAELISKRADATKNNMGLTSFEGVKVRKKDISVAKTT